MLVSAEGEQAAIGDRRRSRRSWSAEEKRRFAFSYMWIV